MQLARKICLLKQRDAGQTLAAPCCSLIWKVEQSATRISCSFAFREDVASICALPTPIAPVTDNFRPTKQNKHEDPLIESGNNMLRLRQLNLEQNFAKIGARSPNLAGGDDDLINFQSPQSSPQPQIASTSELIAEQRRRQRHHQLQDIRTRKQTSGSCAV